MLPGNYVTLIKVMQVLHLINTRVGLILLYISMGVASSTFIIYGFVSSVPREMDESAAMDGARPLRLFFSIIFPLLQPVMITVGILTFLNVWNDFITPLYMLNRSSAWPMTLSIYNFFGRYQQDWNLVFADMVLTVLPVVVVYLLGQKSIVSGMIAGAVKG
jgi:raffinose/stachyose/melibiose transport system permease protein